jgi:hypothetical protein
MPFADALVKKCCDFEVVSKALKGIEICQESKQDMDKEGI